jgi:HEPN domain-containing protein
MNENTSKYWIELAEYDIKSAKVMYKGKRYLYVGFLCHLTAEKALKAVIANKGIFPLKIHSLPRLAEIAGLNDILSDEQNELLDELYPLNIEARYSEYKDTIAKILSRKKCKIMINRTEDLLIWIKNRL